MGDPEVNIYCTEVMVHVKPIIALQAQTDKALYTHFKSIVTTI